MPFQNSLHQLFYCKWKGSEIPAAAARLCDYLNPDNYTCRHSGELCVATAGLEQFAQSLAESAPSTVISPDIFLKMRDIVEKEKRNKKYAEIAKLADHIYGPSKAPPKD